MNEEARIVVDTIKQAFDIFSKMELPTGEQECTLSRDSAMSLIDEIESLSTQLDQVTRERDGLNIMLTQAQAMLETRTKERDAAVNIMAENPRCETCKHYTPGYFCVGCRRGDKWQWRGVEVEG